MISEKVDCGSSLDYPSFRHESKKNRDESKFLPWRISVHMDESISHKCTRVENSRGSWSCNGVEGLND